MADHKLLYRWSLQDAIAHNEVQDWRDSYRENCDCARAIERSIADHYHEIIIPSLIQGMGKIKKCALAV